MNCLISSNEIVMMKTRKLIRIKNTREPHRILIVSEGKETEPNYFNAFPEKPDVKVIALGTGRNTISLVKKTINIKSDAEKKGNRYSYVWCVFDKDDFPIEQFKGAIELARENRIQCAYSIEAFEIWFMLHFDLYKDTLKRTEYNEMLAGLLGKPYNKNDPGLYAALPKKQETAIKNAKTLYQLKCRLPLEKQNPVTTVYRLVEQLL